MSTTEPGEAQARDLVGGTAAVAGHADGVEASLVSAALIVVTGFFLGLAVVIGGSGDALAADQEASVELASVHGYVPF